MTTVEARARRSWRRAIVATILSLTVSGTEIAFDPTDSRVIVQVELAIVGFIAVMLAMGALRRAAPLAPRSLLDGLSQPKPARPPALPLDLIRITRRLAAAEATAADARRHLGPLAAAIAADRLQTRTDAEMSDAVYAYLPRPVPAPLALVLDPALDDVDTRELPGLDADGTEALVRALEQL